jgi:CRISPR-associated protein Cmr5
MNSQKIESGRAEFALAEVKRVMGANDVKLKEYKSYCKKFPSMAQSNGLAAAVAFAKEKGGAWRYVYSHAEERLRNEKFFGEGKTLLEYVCSLETAQYRVVTKEVLALFNWIRRFASGLIEEEE